MNNVHGEVTLTVGQILLLVIAIIVFFIFGANLAGLFTDNTPIEQPAPAPAPITKFKFTDMSLPDGTPCTIIRGYRSQFGITCNYQENTNE